MTLQKSLDIYPPTHEITPKKFKPESSSIFQNRTLDTFCFLGFEQFSSSIGGKVMTRQGQSQYGGLAVLKELNSLRKVFHILD